MKKTLKIVLPMVIIFFAVCAYAVMVQFKKKPKAKSDVKRPVTVKTIKAQPRDVTLRVKSRGTVKPRTETVLMAEISGKITYVSPSFYSGGFIDKDEIILEVEKGDYLDAVVQSKANLARAQLKLIQEEAMARQAEKEWQELGRGKPSSLVLREPQLKEARAEYLSAQAQLRSDQRNLKRTKIHAPFSGMISRKDVDVGQYVSPGIELASFFAVDYAEIRLPITNRDLAYLELPKSYLSKNPVVHPVKVKLTANLAGVRHKWDGQITRTESLLDDQSRVIYVIAQVQDPYVLKADNRQHPLPMGLFVEASITGIALENSIILPRHVLRNNDSILIVDNKNRLQSRKVSIFKADGPTIIIRNGISPGDRVCMTPLDVVIENMKVQPIPHVPPVEAVQLSLGDLS